MKLNDEKGESIAEVLVAILVACFGLLILATMITVSSKLIKESQSRIEEYYLKLNDVERQDGAAESGTVVFSDTNLQSEDIYYYVSDYNGIKIISYKRAN